MQPFKYIIPDREDVALGKATHKRLLAGVPIQGNRKALAAAKKSNRPVSRTSTIDRLRAMAANVKYLVRPEGRVAAQEWLDEALNNIDTDQYRQDTTAEVRAALEGDKDARVALARRIAVNTGHLIRANGTWIQWYQQVTLAADEHAMIRQFVPQQIDVRIGTADGTVTTREAMPDIEDDYIVDMFFLNTDVFSGPIFDRLRGFVADGALATVDLALDLSAKLDALLQSNLLVGAPGSPFVTNFVNDGTPASHYHLDGRVLAANLPAGNIIAPASNTGSTKPRFDVIKAIDAYYSQWGDIQNPDMTGFGTQIHVASGIASQFGDEFDPSSVNGTNPYQTHLYGNRTQIPYNGRNYTIVPDPTLDPTGKYVYVTNGAPIGIHFDKPAGALVHREDDQFNNEFSTFQRGLYGRAYPVTWAPRALAVKFKS